MSWVFTFRAASRAAGFLKPTSGEDLRAVPHAHRKAKPQIESSKARFLPIGLGTHKA